MSICVAVRQAADLADPVPGEIRCTNDEHLLQRRTMHFLSRIELLGICPREVPTIYS
jgi:hypothetical protein